MFTLNIDHPAAAPCCANYCVASLRPTNDSIISVDRSGRVVTTFADDVWDLTPYASRMERLHFDVSGERACAEISKANKLVWKCVMFWALYGLRTPVAVSSVCGMFQSFRYVASACSTAGIRIDQLARFPKVYECLGKIRPSMWPALRTLLARLYVDREELGFEVLGPTELAAIGRKIPRHVSAQTAFIPDRIYFYVLDRCEEVVDRYLQKQEEFERLYLICSDAYERARTEFGPNAQIGRLEERKINGMRVHFGVLELYGGGSFERLASDLGVLEIVSSLTYTSKQIGTLQLGTYLTTVALASRILLAGYSAAREGEHGGFELDCLEVRDDNDFGRAYLLKGATAKTKVDENAYWTTSSVAEKAVAAATSIAILRSQEAQRNPKYREHFETGSKMLFPRVTDPWIGRTDVLKSLRSASAEVSPRSTLSVVLRGGKGLFDPKQMTIRQEDIDQAVRLNPDLSPATFAVGKVWPLAWHQFRRTLVCHASGAGVSLAATAWQLKHAGVWMAQHYRNNYFSLASDPDLADEFARTQVEVLLIRAHELTNGDFVPLSLAGKAIAVKLITDLEDKALKQAAREGRLTFRETGPGLCTHPSCVFGGWEDVAHCVGCAFGFAQRSKRPMVIRMLSLARGELAECGPGDLLVAQSLSAQVDALEELSRVTE